MAIFAEFSHGLNDINACIHGNACLTLLFEKLPGGSCAEMQFVQGNLDDVALVDSVKQTEQFCCECGPDDKSVFTTAPVQEMKPNAHASGLWLMRHPTG